jgi:hypothetical protein
VTFYVEGSLEISVDERKEGLPHVCILLGVDVRVRPDYWKAV